MINELVKQKCILALDTQDDQKISRTLSEIQGQIDWVKVGMELYFSKGSEILHVIANQGFKVFLDLKLHDIPQTVHNAVLSLTKCPFHLLTIHLQGGENMIEVAADALRIAHHPAKLLGVSVLTSFDENHWQNTQAQKVTIHESIQTLIQQRSTNQLYGVVSSGHEVSTIKKSTNLKTVVPGIRWATSNNDQARVMTPAQALKLGADHLVIGREITNSPNISKAIQSLKDHLHENFYE